MTPGALVAAWGAGLAVLWIPGIALARLLPGPRDPFVRLALAGGAGLAFWPVLLLATTHAGIRWGSTATRGLLFCGVLFLAAATLRAGRYRIRPRLTHGLTLLVLALTAATRVAQVRDLALPPWVDSVHHQLVLEAVLERGGVPASYAPVLPGVPAVYHWGFHAGAAAVAWLLGVHEPFALARLLLQYGQLLNVLAVLALAAGARVLFASRSAGVLAALLGGLVSWFPAFYVAWGRYPQLAGAVVLVPLAIASWSLGRGRRRPGPPLLAGFLAAGLFLVHVRVAFLAATLLALLAPLLFLRRRGRAMRDAALAAALALTLCGAWLASLATARAPGRALAPSTAAELAAWRTANQVPTDLLVSPNARELTSVASLGLTGMAGWAAMPPAGRFLSGALWVAVLVAESRRRRTRPRARAPLGRLLLLWGWSALTVLLINLDRLGLPPLRLVPNGAAVIFAFVPLCGAAAGVLAWLAGRLAPPLRTRSAAAAAVAGASLWGASQMLDVVPALTVLATHRDAAALRWVAAHVPPSARFAVRAMPWTGGTFVGRDGGYWLSVLTGRASNVPPALYPFLPEPALGAVRERLTRWAEAGTPDGPGVVPEMREERATHLFAGENRGPLSALDDARTPGLRAIYRDGPVAVFVLR